MSSELCVCGPTTVAAGFCECGADPDLAPLVVHPADTRECDGYPALAATSTIDLDESTVRLGVVLGLMRRAEDGVYELTELGSGWLRQYLEERKARGELEC